MANGLAADVGGIAGRLGAGAFRGNLYCLDIFHVEKPGSQMGAALHLPGKIAPTLSTCMSLWPFIKASDRSRAQEALQCYSFADFSDELAVAPSAAQLTLSFAMARRFAGKTNFRAARRQLNISSAVWREPCGARPGPVLVIAHCSIKALALIAEIAGEGRELLVEDCAFTREYVIPVKTGAKSRISLLPGGHIPARLRDLALASQGEGVVCMTFCDRAAETASEYASVEILGGGFDFSVLDALLISTQPGLSLVLGRELRPVAIHLDWQARGGYVTGEALLGYACLCARHLEEQIKSDSAGYLGINGLVTRGRKWRAQVRNNKCSLLKSLLHYCQLNGVAVPPGDYHELLAQLDIPLPTT